MSQKNGNVLAKLIINDVCGPCYCVASFFHMQHDYDPKVLPSRIPHPPVKTVIRVDAFRLLLGIIAWMMYPHKEISNDPQVIVHNGKARLSAGLCDAYPKESKSCPTTNKNKTSDLFVKGKASISYVWMSYVLLCWSYSTAFALDAPACIWGAGQRG